MSDDALIVGLESAARRSTLEIETLRSRVGELEALLSRTAVDAHKRGAGARIVELETALAASSKIDKTDADYDAIERASVPGGAPHPEDDVRFDELYGALEGLYEDGECVEHFAGNPDCQWCQVARRMFDEAKAVLVKHGFNPPAPEDKNSEHSAATSGEANPDVGIRGEVIAEPKPHFSPPVATPLDVPALEALAGNDPVCTRCGRKWSDHPPSGPGFPLCVMPSAPAPREEPTCAKCGHDDAWHYFLGQPNPLGCSGCGCGYVDSPAPRDYKSICAGCNTYVVGEHEKSCTLVAPLMNAGEPPSADPLEPLVLLLGEFSVDASERRTHPPGADPTQRCLVAMETARSRLAAYVLREPLEALVKEWRDQGDWRLHGDSEDFAAGDRLHACANELQKLLSGSAGKGP